MDHRRHAETLPNSGDQAASTVTRSAEVRAWHFDGFEFDLVRGELRGRDGVAVPLRPKAEMLLRRFLSQPRCLLSRDQLIDAVWPAAVVTDDSLVKCIGELRAALDDGGQRMIQTVPRRGYRFEAAVAPVSGTPLAASTTGSFEPALMAVEPVTPTIATVPARPPRIRRWLASLMLVTTLALIGGASYFLGSTRVPIDIDEVVRSRATLAVMPFVASGDSAQLRNAANVVADGIAGQLATRMGMRGIGRAATAAFDGASPPLQRIGTELKATHVATVRAAPAGAGGRVSIDVQIIAVASGEVIWARHFEGSEASAEPLATDVGQQVAVAMRRRGPLEANLRAARAGHTPDAADLALMGWGDLDARKSIDDVWRARHRFEAASRDDPRSAIALTGLSATYLTERADPMSRVAPEQIAEHERVTDMAIKLAPDNDTALVQWGNMQIMRGRPDLALPAFEKANRLVPSQPSYYVSIAIARLLLGRADEVQALVDRAVVLGAGDARRVGPAYAIAAEAALMCGEDERARDLAHRAIAELPSNARAHATLAAIDALAGRHEAAAAEMAAFRDLWPTATLARYDELRRSTHPVYLSTRERLYEGLRKAGLSE